MPSSASAPKRKRALHALAAETSTPPDALAQGHQIARVRGATGKNLYVVELPSLRESTETATAAAAATVAADAADAAAAAPTTASAPTTTTTTPATTILVELPARFRSTVWMRRGSYVVVDTGAGAARANKLGGEIVNVVREEKRWRKMGFWPREFGERERERRGEGEEEEEDEESDEGPRFPVSSDEEDEG